MFSKLYFVMFNVGFNFSPGPLMLVLLSLFLSCHSSAVCTQLKGKTLEQYLMSPARTCVTRTDTRYSFLNIYIFIYIVLILTFSLLKAISTTLNIVYL